MPTWVSNSLYQGSGVTELVRDPSSNKKKNEAGDLVVIEIGIFVSHYMHEAGTS